MFYFTKIVDERLFLLYINDTNNVYACSINNEDDYVKTHLQNNINQLKKIFDNNELLFEKDDVENMYIVKINREIYPFYCLEALYNNDLMNENKIQLLENENNFLKSEITKLETIIQKNNENNDNNNDTNNSIFNNQYIKEI
jgi:hypothetical protein